MEKKIVFINQNAGYIMIDIIDAFSSKYDVLALITGNLVIRSKNLPKDVVLHKIIKYNRSNKYKRIYTWCIGSFQIFLQIILRYRDSHLFIVTNPPISPLLPLITKNPFISCSYIAFTLINSLKSPGTDSF